MVELDIVTIYSGLKLSRYFAVAAITLSVYDWIVLLPDEVEFIAKARLSKGKVLYYFSRIVTLVGLLISVYHLVDGRRDVDNNFCRFFFWATPLFEIISIFASYWLLTLRLIALYKSKPMFVWLLYFSLFVSYFISLGLLIRAIIGFTSAFSYSTTLHVCVPLGSAASLEGVIQAPLAFEAILFGLTAYNAWKDYRDQAANGLRPVPLLRVLYRDGILYFCVITGTHIWNIITIAQRPIYEMYTGLYFMWTMITLLACRIYLNIVREARKNRLTAVSMSLGSRQYHVHSDHTSQAPTNKDVRLSHWEVHTMDHRVGDKEAGIIHIN